MVEPRQQTEPEGSTFGRCYWHSDQETGLSCSQCGKHICAQCMVQAPVGIRCKVCGKASPMPTYDVNAVFYGRAAAAALGVTVVGGVLWLFINAFFAGVPFVTGLVGIGVGYAAGELISLSVNRKRSKGLAWIAGGSVAGAFLVTLSTGAFPYGLWALLLIIVGVAVAVQRVRP